MIYLGYAKNDMRYQCEDSTTSITFAYYFWLMKEFENVLPFLKKGGGGNRGQLPISAHIFANVYLIEN